LSIIIVNWNGGGLLKRCVETIVSSEPRVTYEVVIIDNASEDDSLEQLNQSETAAFLNSNQQLRIFKNSENRGFGAANNQAFGLTDSPFVLLLNLDTEVHPGTIDTLMRTIVSDPKIGGCGPKILNGDGSLQISAFFNPPRVWHTFLSQLKLYYLLPPRVRGELLLGQHWPHDRQRSVPMLSGAAMLARRQMIEKVGGFDERFHMYAEDNEWCCRITRSDWKLVFVPDAVVLHHGGQSSMKRWTSDEKLRVKLEAGFNFENRVLPRWRLAANQLANYIVVSAQIAARQVRGIQIPEPFYVVKETHREHLMRSLRNHLERD
ncbi:MAG TPA: glycosyltransferase family 2 protein, partial [Pyrinomonadaceae bacterium]|nr:glycosyltransferase family 2 protein [Pyrinomonadaceae bacterium]